MSEHLKIEPSSIARHFADALDKDDFASAEGLLASTCLYQARNVELSGAAAVIGSYREASVWAKGNLDVIEYASQVEVVTESQATVIFIDHITHQGKSHTYQCRQVLSLGAAGRIEHIRHIEIPGQREALREFLAAVGLSRS